MERKLKFSVSEARDGKDFVGIKLSSTDCEVVFPMGFSVDYEINGADFPSCRTVVDDTQGCMEILPHTGGEIQIRHVGVCVVANGVFLICKTEILHRMAAAAQNVAQLQNVGLRAAFGI